MMALVDNVHAKVARQHCQILPQSFATGANLPQIMITIQLGQQQRAAFRRLVQPEDGAIAAGADHGQRRIAEQAEMPLAERGGKDTFADFIRQAVELNQELGARQIEANGTTRTGGLVIEQKPVIADHPLLCIKRKTGQVEITGGVVPAQTQSQFAGAGERRIGALDEFFHGGGGHGCGIPVCP